MTTNTAEILRPEDVHRLITLPVMEASVAAQVANVINTNSTTLRFPLVTGDPSAEWTAEGEEIETSTLTTDEVSVTPAALKGLSIVSNELLADSSPEASAAIGAGLARDLARKLDLAFFGAKGSNTVQPEGLLDLKPDADVGEGPDVINLDFAEKAVYAASLVDAELTSFVCSPALALAIATLKTEDGSNESLLATDATARARRTVGGLPLYTTPAITDTKVLYGIPKQHVHLVIRQNVSLQVSGESFFTSDRTAIRATMRVGWALTHPDALIKVVWTPETP